MEESVPTTPAGNTVADEGDNPKDDSVVLAQPAATPLAQNKEDRISTDAPTAQSYPYSI